MSDIAHYLSRRPNPQPPIFEQALIDCIDIFSMGGISESTRFKLIWDILVTAKAEDDRFQRENHMRVQFRTPKHKPAKYRSNLSQIFYACHRLATLSGNPAPKSIEIRKIIEESRLFDSFTPTDDYWASRRGPKAPRKPSFKSPPTLLVEEIDLEKILPAPSEEVIVPKVTIIHEANTTSDGPGLNIALPLNRRAVQPVASTEDATPAPEPYTPD